MYFIKTQWKFTEEWQIVIQLSQLTVVFRRWNQLLYMTKDAVRGYLFLNLIIISSSKTGLDKT